MKKVLLRGPVLTRSGYGEHARFVLEALLKNTDFDVYVVPLNWGQSNWLFEDSEKRKEIDDLIQKTANANESFDMSIQVTIPNEWEKIAPINIGICAGIETDKVSMAWIKKANDMDRVIVVSEHAKSGFTKTKYSFGTSNDIIFKCETPVDIVHYGVKDVETMDLDLGLTHKFNFLTVAQMGPRKNLVNTVKWFVEEFKEEEVGLVVKAHWMNNSLVDRRRMTGLLRQVLEDVADRKCSVHLVHGNMTDEEVHSLYAHPNIKAYVTATHGEGFGLPIFEAAYSGLPVVAPSWSGHVDFLSAPVKNEKSGKVRKTALYEKVAYELNTPQPEALWKDVVEQDSKWCYPKKNKFMAAMRSVYQGYNLRLKNANTLQQYLVNNFKYEDKLTQMCEIITETGETNEII